MWTTATAERGLIERVLEALGAPPEAAACQARWLTEADVVGLHSHGIRRLPLLVERIRRGLLRPAAACSFDWESPSVATVDGGQGFGPVAGTFAMRLAAERAATTGVAIAAVRNANHLGILAPYVREVAEAGAVAVALGTSEALVHPFGGRVAMLGTNPIAIGIPASPDPFVLDMATGVVSMGKILHFAEAGQTLEPGWAIDAAGEPTTDPVAASNGSIAPFGQAKGFGLGLAIELLVAMLSESAYGSEVRGTLDATEPCNKGDLFVCIDTPAIGRGSRAASAFLDAIRSCPPEEAGRPVRVPGDRAAQARRSIEAGDDAQVEIAEELWALVGQLAGA